jgi:hypothetical protein
VRRTGSSPGVRSPGSTGASRSTATTSEWLEGDPTEPTRRRVAEPAADGRNTEWQSSRARRRHLDAGRVGVPVVRDVGPRLPLRRDRPHGPGVRQGATGAHVREWAMHPNGQLAAYEWNFSDVNPPVHAWAAWQVYAIDGRHHGFLTGLHQAALNFGWWVNRKDSDGSQSLRGWLPRDGQHRPLRPLRADARRGRGWSSPTRRAGWPSSAWSMLRISWELARTISLGRAGDEVLRALLRHRRGDGDLRHRQRRCGTRRTASTTTSSSTPTAGPRRSRSAPWSGCCRSWPSPTSPTGYRTSSTTSTGA